MKRTLPLESLRVVDRLRSYLQVVDPDNPEIHGKRWQNVKFVWLTTLDKNRGLYRDEPALIKAIDHLEIWRDDPYCPRIRTMSQLINKLGAIRDHYQRHKGEKSKHEQKEIVNRDRARREKEFSSAQQKAVSPEEAAANARAIISTLAAGKAFKQ